MRFTLITMFAVGLLALAAAPARADDHPGSRDIQAAVDSYLATGGDDASLIGGTGSAGYDAGFWIRGGDFLLRINATLQARYEAWQWDDKDLAGQYYNGVGDGAFAGDTSGFSLPRATLKFSGEAPCNIRYYIELEFGHWGRNISDRGQDGSPPAARSGSTFMQLPPRFPSNLGPTFDQSNNFDNTREAWIEWGYGAAFNVRMGQVGLPTTRQLQTNAELQQFVDVSLASAWTGIWLPGYTTRNRDHGILIHGALGCNNEWSYMFSATNGDGGDSIRNVIDHRSSDNLAYGARINWAFLKPIGYEEGALRQQTCDWYGEVGAWGFYYADRVDAPHETVADIAVYGLDLALGWGGLSFTGAYTIMQAEPGVGPTIESTSWLVQLGYHFPGTAWEVAARADGYDYDSAGGMIDTGMLEYAFAVNYYLNGHANKLTLDASFLSSSDGTFLWYDFGAGYNAMFSGSETDAMLLRFQWQLAL